MGSFFPSPVVLGPLEEMTYWQGGLLESGVRLLESRPIFPPCPVTLDRFTLCTPVSLCCERGLVISFPSPTHPHAHICPSLQREALREQELCTPNVPGDTILLDLVLSHPSLR